MQLLPLVRQSSKAALYAVQILSTNCEELSKKLTEFRKAQNAKAAHGTLGNLIMENNYIAPGNWLGLMGGGQLGKMFAQAAATLGYKVCVLEPDKNAPAAAVSLQHIIAPYTEPMALEELASHCKGRYHGI